MYKHILIIIMICSIKYFFKLKSTICIHDFQIPLCYSIMIIIKSTSPCFWNLLHLITEVIIFIVGIILVIISVKILKNWYLTEIYLRIGLQTLRKQMNLDYCNCLIVFCIMADTIFTGRRSYLWETGYLVIY